MKICPVLAEITSRLKDDVQALENELHGIKPSFFEVDPSKVQAQIRQLKKKIKRKLHALDQITKAAKGQSELQKMFDRTI